MIARHWDQKTGKKEGKLSEKNREAKINEFPVQKTGIGTPGLVQP